MPADPPGGPDSPGRIAYLGPPGTFSEAALAALPEARAAAAVPLPTVTAVIAAVRSGEVDAAVVPLENSVEGPVAATLDALADPAAAPVQVRREVLLEVSFALLARPGVSLDDVRTVATHPHGEAQCRGWLARTLPAAQVRMTASTADGAALVAAGGADAALAAAHAGGPYGLVVLASDVADTPGAVTRFVLVTPAGPPPPRTGADRTSVVAFIADDHPGALLELLTEFAVRGVNLTRIESRPTKAGLGRYCFSIDCEGHVADARVGEALSALRRSCAEVRFLGSYPRADAGALEPTPLRPGTGDADFAAAARWLAGLRGAPPG